MRSGWTFGSRHGPAGRDAGPAELSAFADENFGAHASEGHPDNQSGKAQQPPGDAAELKLRCDCDQRRGRTLGERGRRRVASVLASSTRMRQRIRE